MPVATAAFTLTSAVFGAIPKARNATSDAQIHLYPFVTPECAGQPFTSPYEMKQGECINMNQARSLKPRYRSEHGDWVREVSNLQMHCKLETFSDFGCSEANKINEYRRGHNGDLPKHLNSCLTPERQKDGSNSFFSARFVCGKLENPEHMCTKIVKHTTWSIDSTSGAPHYMVNTATYTASLTMPAQASPAVDKRFDPGRERKGVWMYHPWSLSLQCFLCYPKKQHDYRKIECRAGADFPANCGPEPTPGPNGKPKTPFSYTTTTTTKVRTIHSTTTTTVLPKSTGAGHSDSSSESSSDDDLPRLDIELQQKKSWHTPVKFPHPFVDGKEACADAEWEKRGQIGRDYVKIQKVHFCDKEDRKDSQWIGLPAAQVHTVHETRETATTMMHTEVEPRHDQL